LPNDQLTHDNRYAYSINDTTNLSEHWQSILDYNKVSDQNYLQDFGSQTSAVIANQVLLNQSLALNYNSLHWTFNGIIQTYQVVNPLLDVGNQPYNEYPATELQAQYPNALNPFSFSLDSGFTNFEKSADGSSIEPVNGQRVYVAPTISLPLTKSYGFFTPSLTVNGTGYSLQNTAVNALPNDSITRTLPIFDIDTGLYFDRDFDMGDNAYTQTLEPRLFYLFVPYTNQNDIPVFDTSVNSFSYNSLFSTNRFSGLDRIGDANQISAALQTNINNSQGQQLFNAAIGQIYYFENRQVSLCTNTPGQPPCIITENPQYNQPYSDVVGTMGYNFNPEWSVNGSLTYNPKFTLLDSQDYQLQYQPDNQHLFNIEYETNNYDYGLLSNEQILAGTTPPRISQVNASTVWNILQSWSVVGSVSYSLNYNNIISQFAGLQYDACCWAARFLVYQYVVNDDPNIPAVISGPKNTTLMVQFELKGLGSEGLGNNGAQINGLLNGIPGYNNQLGF
jgi:LPS-assembly protein